jgi:hypothetical protein
MLTTPVSPGHAEARPSHQQLVISHQLPQRASSLLEYILQAVSDNEIGQCKVPSNALILAFAHRERTTSPLGEYEFSAYLGTAAR